MHCVSCRAAYRRRQQLAAFRSRLLGQRAPNPTRCSICKTGEGRPSFFSQRQLEKRSLKEIRRDKGKVRKTSFPPRTAAFSKESFLGRSVSSLGCCSLGRSTFGSRSAVSPHMTVVDVSSLLSPGVLHIQILEFFTETGFDLLLQLSSEKTANNRAQALTDI